MKNLTIVFNSALIAFVVFNFFNNLVIKEININFNIYDFILSIILFLFLYFIGSYIRSSLNLESTSLTIVLYLVSFFVIENMLQLTFQNYKFSFNFLIVNIFWLIVLIYKKTKFTKLLQVFSIFYTLRTLTNYFFDKLTINENLRGDVKEYFFIHTKNIYENSYAHSINFSVIEGYPQFSSYLHGLLNKFLISSSEYAYLMSSTLVLFVFSIYVIYEFIEVKKYKLLISILYVSLIINSDFLQFLFTSSLMSEGLITLATAVIFFNLSNYRKNNIVTNNITFLLTGILYHAKQFTSLIIVILFFYFIYKKYYKLSSLIAFGIFLKELTYLTIFKNNLRSHHLSQIDIKDTIFDLFLFRDLNLNNILKIINNLFIDKPMTALVIIFFTFFVSLLVKKKINSSIIFLVSINILNILFVFILYISVWREMELESPIRFIYTYLLLQLIVVGKGFELENKY